MSEGVTIEPADVLSYWFSDEVKPKWFAPDAAFDSELQRRFGPALESARRGELTAWEESPEGMLAQLILLDQVSRNIFRGTPAAFASDDQALALTKLALSLGIPGRFPPEQRAFFYLPFMHSERLEEQERGVELYTALGLEEQLRYMHLHRDVIARFGRFPHRNAILGRASTAEEVEFLKQPGSRF